MTHAVAFGALILCLGTAVADSGGPYVAVPDLKPSEVPPIFAIPKEAQPLRFFLTNIPELRRNKKLNEPDFYNWRGCTEHHASVASLGNVSGHEILCVRYTSNRRLDRGLDYADSILLIARGQDSGPAPTLCSPIFYSTGGPGVYDHVAKYFSAERTGAVVVTRYYEGTGAFRDHIYIRGGDRGFERFAPQNPQNPQR